LLTLDVVCARYDHRIEIGAVPPDMELTAVPLLPPKQLTAVVAVMVTFGPAISLMMAMLEV
jgi:hypothetical protein